MEGHGFMFYGDVNREYCEIGEMMGCYFHKFACPIAITHQMDMKTAYVGTMNATE